MKSALFMLVLFKAIGFASLSSLDWTGVLLTETTETEADWCIQIRRKRAFAARRYTERERQ
jgi:hypothetical protein